MTPGEGCKEIILKMARDSIRGNNPTASLPATLRIGGLGGGVLPRNKCHPLRQGR